MLRTSVSLVLVAIGIALRPAWLPAQRSAVDTDARGVKVLFDDQFARLYNAADAAGLAALWIETGTLDTSVPGKPRVIGRSAIRAMWSAEFSENRPWPSVTVVLRNARLIGGRRAEVDGVLNYSNPAESTVPTSSFTAVAVAEQGQWRIQSMRVSQLRGARID